MLRIRQIVFVVRDLAASSRRLAELLALDAPFRDPGVAEFGIDNAVFAFGDQFIELVSPVRADTAAGRHLDRRGEGGYMLILQADDFEGAHARIRALGVRTVWEKTLPDIRAMHLHPKDIGGAIVSVDQPVPPASWRWGGPSWRIQGGARGRQRVVGVTVAAADPPAMAARWAEVLGRPAAIPHGQRHAPRARWRRRRLHRRAPGPRRHHRRRAASGRRGGRPERGKRPGERSVRFNRGFRDAHSAGVAVVRRLISATEAVMKEGTRVRTLSRRLSLPRRQLASGCRYRASSLRQSWHRRCRRAN